MSSATESRCAYFFLTTAEIAMPGTHQPLRVPVCRCMLTEVLIARLEVATGHDELLTHIHGPSLDGQRRPVIGSDWDIVSPKTCTQKRKQEKCLPSFVEVLTDLGLDASIPRKTEAPRDRSRSSNGTQTVCRSHNQVST